MFWKKTRGIRRSKRALIEPLDSRLLLTGGSPLPDTTPSSPKGFVITEVTTTSISFGWVPSTDNGYIAGYRVFRDGIKVKALPGTFFSDVNLKPGTKYTYSVRAVDNEDVFSSMSRTISAATVPIVVEEPTRDPFHTIKAYSYDKSSGIGHDGNEIRLLSDGDKVAYSRLNFGDTGAKSVSFNLALDRYNPGGTIELRLDSANGKLIGTHRVQPTGSSTTFQNQKLDISTTTGVHDLYLVFRGGDDIAHIHSLVFSTTHLIKIMPLGDSITEAFSDTPSYRWFLWQSLQKLGYNVDFVGSQITAMDGVPPNLDFDQNHEGHPGWLATDLAAYAQGWAEQFKPDIVLLHAGSNDAEMYHDTDSAINALRDIIVALRRAVPHVKIIMAQLLPDKVNQAGIDAINARIPALAAAMTEHLSPVQVVDMATGFSAADQQDGIHLNAEGEQKFSDRWLESLIPLL